MGKIRRQRQKYHLARKSDSLNDGAKAKDDISTKKSDLTARNLFKSNENIFAGIKQEDILKNLSQDFDAKSMVSCKSRREEKLETQHLKKKEKMRLRRERFMNSKIFIVETVDSILFLIFFFCF